MSSSRKRFSLGVSRRTRAREEMREELAFHIESRVAALVSRGMTPDEARAEATRAGFRHDVPLPSIRW